MSSDSYITFGTISCVWKWKLEVFGQIALTTEEPGTAKYPLPLRLTLNRMNVLP